ncbi:MAG: hypothetical protein AAB685_02010 [Patescibacteria group bacterium]
MDPAISSKELKEVLETKRAKNYKFEQISGNDHHYEDLNLLNKLIQEFV